MNHQNNNTTSNVNGHQIIDFKEIIRNAFVAGFVIFVISYGGLFLAIRIFPDFFVQYINPVFNSDGSRDVYFYLHPFILGLSLSIFWSRFYKFFRGNFLLTGLEFGLTYGFVALLPILWITFAAMDVEFQMVFSWMIYGIFQSSVGGIVFYMLQLRKK